MLRHLMPLLLLQWWHLKQQPCRQPHLHRNCCRGFLLPLPVLLPACVL
jgi:hypothetical protein